MLTKWIVPSAVVLAFCCLATPSRAALIEVDEWGTGIGTVGSGFFAPDPGPGGLPRVLTYQLPFATIIGDVGMTDADAGGAVLDWLRFNGNTLLFYSDNVDGFDEPADIFAPPSAHWANSLLIPEVGVEGNNGAFYTPLAGQPGAVPGLDLTYHFISDGKIPTAVPEPLTVGLGLASLGALALVATRRRNT